MSQLTTSPASTLLDIAMKAAPDPPQMGKALTLTFSATKRPGAGRVYCDWVSLHVDVDESCTQETALTCTADGIGNKPTPDTAWTLLKASGGTFTFVPKGDDEVTEGFTLELRNIVVSSVLGTATVTVTESTTDHDESSCDQPDHSDCYEPRTTTFKVPKFPEDFGQVVFQADPTAVDPGGAAKLSWRADTSGVYALLADDTPVDATKIVKSDNADGTATWSYTAAGLADDTSFTLRVTYQSGDIHVTRDYYAVVLVRNPTLVLQVHGDPYVREDEPVRLTWQIAHVDQCQVKIKGHREPAYNVGQSTYWDARPKVTSTYVLSGMSGAGNLVTSNEVDITVIPPVATVVPDLVFIKTAGTDGHVEVYVADGAHGFQQACFGGKSPFEIADGPNGTWQVARYMEDTYPPDLLFVKTGDTGGPAVVLWWAPGIGGHDPAFSAMTSFALRLGPQGRWQALPMNTAYPRYERPDLAFIQTANTDQVHVYATMHSNQFHQPISEWTTRYAASDAQLGTFQMVDMDGADGRPADLAFIQTAGTPTDRVEVSFATGASGYTRLGNHWVTDFPTGDAGSGSWQLVDIDGDGHADLVFVKTSDTGSGRVEVYYALHSDNYKNPPGAAGPLGGYTMFDVADAANGTWQVVPFPLGPPTLS